MTIAQVEKTGLRYVDGLLATRRKLWIEACKHDGIVPDGMFVVFSDGNPYTPFLDRVTEQLREAVEACQPGGGYVGLHIKNGRAVTQ